MAEAEDAELERLVAMAQIDIGDESTLSDLAAYCGYSHTQTRNKLEAAGLSPNARKEWPTAVAVRVLCRAKNPAIILARVLDGEGNAAAHAALGIGATPGKSNISELAAAKAEREKIQTELIRAKAQKLSGDLVSRKAVTEAATDFASLTRNAILALPLRLAAKLEGKSRAEIVEILDDEVRKLCEGLAESAEHILQDATL